MLNTVAKRFLIARSALEPSFADYLMSVLDAPRTEAHVGAATPADDPDMQGVRAVGQIAVVPVIGVLVHSYTSAWGRLQAEGFSEAFVRFSEASTAERAASAPEPAEERADAQR